MCFLNLLPSFLWWCPYLELCSLIWDKATRQGNICSKDVKLHLNTCCLFINANNIQNTWLYMSNLWVIHWESGDLFSWKRSEPPYRPRWPRQARDAATLLLRAAARWWGPAGKYGAREAQQDHWSTCGNNLTFCLKRTALWWFNRQKKNNKKIKLGLFKDQNKKFACQIAEKKPGKALI